MTIPLTILTAPTEELDIATRQAIIQVCFAAFQEEDFKRLFDYIPSGGRHFLAYHGDELVGHAVVTTRWLQVDQQPILKTAFVDAVATHPNHQGQGVGSTFMRVLANSIPDYQIGCLQTDRVSFYEGVGWELWRGPLAGRGKDGLVETPDQQGVMILRLAHTPPLSLDGLLTIECQTSRIW